MGKSGRHFRNASDRTVSYCGNGNSCDERERRYKAITDCIRAVDEQPTVFDVDKVVEQLKTKKTRTAALQKASEYFEGETDAFEVAIKIVKDGES